MMSEEVTRDAGLTAMENLKRKMKACVDRFLSKLEEVLQTERPDKKFDFLPDVKILTFFMGTAPVWLQEKCDYFANQYSETDGNDFQFEITDVISLIKA